VASVPGVQSAGIISYLPFTGLGAGTNVSIVGQPPPPPGQDLVTDVTVCDNGYFQTMRIAALRGRLFTEREMRERSNVVVVNEALAKRYFPNQDPLGKQLVINMNSPNVPTEIIGVVANSKFSDLRAEVRPASYWPHPQLPYTAMTFTIRTASDPAALAAVVEHEIQTIDKDQPVSDVRTMDQWVARSLAQARFSSMLLGVFAALALALASIGIYGMMSYVVGQRTSEIGIRLALGAERRDILAMIVGSAMRLAATGLAIGVVLALLLSRTLSTLLFETTGTDPVTFGLVVLVLGAVALLASYLPARRASRIAPIEALRYQLSTAAMPAGASAERAAHARYQRAVIPREVNNDRQHSSRFALRASYVRAESGLRRARDPDDRDRRRRQHRHLQHRQRSAAPPAAVRGS
jgi:putative ABC transport system permease protein